MVVLVATREAVFANLIVDVIASSVFAGALRAVGAVDCVGGRVGVGERAVSGIAVPAVLIRVEVRNLGPVLERDAARKRRVDLEGDRNRQ